MGTEQKRTPTYVKAVGNHYEYGSVEYQADRRKDKLVPLGTAESYDAAHAALAKATA